MWWTNTCITEMIKHTIYAQYTFPEVLRFSRKFMAKGCKNIWIVTDGCDSNALRIILMYFCIMSIICCSEWQAVSTLFPIWWWKRIQFPKCVLFGILTDGQEPSNHKYNCYAKWAFDLHLYNTELLAMKKWLHSIYWSRLICCFQERRGQKDGKNNNNTETTQRPLRRYIQHIVFSVTLWRKFTLPEYEDEENEQREKHGDVVHRP